MLNINLASWLFRKIEFPYIEDEVIQQYIDKNSKKELKDLVFVNRLTDDQVCELWNFKSLKNQLNIFVIGILLSIGILIARIPNLQVSMDLISYFGLFTFLFIFVFLFRYASITASTFKTTRYGCIKFSLLISIGSYFVFSWIPLYGLDIREYVYTWIEMPPRLANICLSCIVFLVSYALAYPSYIYFNTYRTCSSIEKEVGKWKHCFDTYKEYVSKVQNTQTTCYISMPVPTIILFFIRRFFVGYSIDYYLDIVYVFIEFFMAFYLLKFTEIELRMLVNDNCRYLTAFETNKLESDGRKFQKSLGETIHLLPTTAMSLLAYPLLVVTCCIAFGTSFLVEGFSQEVLRYGSIFLLALMEIVTAMNKVACLFIE